MTQASLEGMQTDWTYTDFGEVSSTQTGSLYDVSYNRDEAGRITEKTVTVNGEQVTESYTYDQAGRLKRVTRNGKTTTYEYDKNGNRLAKDGPEETITGSYDAQDRLKSYGKFDYEYTKDGQLRKKTGPNGTTTYEYDGSLRTKTQCPRMVVRIVPLRYKYSLTTTIMSAY